MSLNLNDVGVTTFSYPVVVLTNADTQLEENFLTEGFEIDDELTVYMSNSDLNPTGGDLIVEVIVGIGDDGRW